MIKSKVELLEETINGLNKSIIEAELSIVVITQELTVQPGKKEKHPDEVLRIKQIRDTHTKNIETNQRLIEIAKEMINAQ